VGTVGAIGEGAGLILMGLAAPESGGTSEAIGVPVYGLSALMTTVAGVGDLGGAIWQGHETGNWRPAIVSGVAFSGSAVGGRWIAGLGSKAARLILGANADMFMTMVQGGPEQMSCPVN